MHIFARTFAATLAALMPLAASAQDTPGRQLAEMAFAGLDGADRGFIDQGEFSNFGSDVFVSMDSDESDSIALAEFLAWDVGFINIAQDAGREEAYETAMRVVFSFWDRDGDGEITRREHRISLMADFQRADLDNDALLTQEEMLSGFSVMVAARAAINPAPVE